MVLPACRPTCCPLPAAILHDSGYHTRLTMRRPAPSPWAKRWPACCWAFWLGCCIAALLTLRPGLEGGVMTLAILVKSTPMVAIAPLLTIWLGFGVLPKVIITALLTFFPVLVNVLSGLQRPDPALLDLFQLLAHLALADLSPPAPAIRPALSVRRPEDQRAPGPDRRGGGRMDRRIRWAWAARCGWPTPT